MSTLSKRNSFRSISSTLDADSAYGGTNDDTLSITSGASLTSSPTKRSMTPRLEVMMKREAKQKEIEENLTFKPKMLTRKSSFSKPSSNDGATRFELLYEDAKKRSAKITDKSANSSFEKEITFQPQLVTRSRSSSRASLHDDNSSVGSTTSSFVDRLYTSSKKDFSQNQAQYSFKPSITKRASSIDRSHMRETTDRLYNLSSQIKAREERVKEERELEVLRKYSFAPTINPKSRDMSAERKRYSEGPKEIHERLLRYEEIKTRRLEAAMEQKRQQELAGVTFKPSINESSKRTPTPTRSGDLFERLAKPVDKEALASKQIALEGELFKPNLSATASKRSPSVRLYVFHPACS